MPSGLNLGVSDTITSPEFAKASLLPSCSEDPNERALLPCCPRRLGDPLSPIPAPSLLKASAPICLLAGSWLARAITPGSLKCQSQFSDVTEWWLEISQGPSAGKPARSKLMRHVPGKRSGGGQHRVVTCHHWFWRCGWAVNWPERKNWGFCGAQRRREGAGCTPFWSWGRIRTRVLPATMCPSHISLWATY